MSYFINPVVFYVVLGSTTGKPVVYFRKGLFMRIYTDQNLRQSIGYHYDGAEQKKMHF